MAITMGGVSSVLASFNAGKEEQTSGPIGQGTIDFITLTFAPIAMIIMVYALFTHETRRQAMLEKTVKSRSSNPCNSSVGHVIDTTIFAYRPGHFIQRLGGRFSSGCPYLDFSGDHICTGNSGLPGQMNSSTRHG
jgi:hypothetical protein